MKWETLCKRTEDPKLAYIETWLTEHNIPHQRSGYSFHGPILEVPAECLDKAWSIFSLKAKRDLGIATRYGVDFDDVPDDHPDFYNFAAHDLAPEDIRNEEADWYAELNSGYAQDRI